MKLPIVCATFLATAVVTAARPASVVTLAVNGRANATPSIAAIGQVVAVAWGATMSNRSSGATDVYVAVSRDAGRRFGPPVRVDDVDGDASLGGEQPPHVALVPRAGREPSGRIGSTLAEVWTPCLVTSSEVSTPKRASRSTSTPPSASEPIAPALLTSALAATGPGVARLTTRLGNVAAVRLYRRLGFRPRTVTVSLHLWLDELSAPRDRPIGLVVGAN